MKPSRLLLSIAPLALTLLLIFSFLTASARPVKPTPPPVDKRKLVKSVDIAASSVVIQYMRDKTLHPYTIDEFTVINVNNVPGKITAIKPGMVVDDFLERDDKTLDNLTLSGQGTAPVAAKPKPQQKPKPTPKPTPTPAPTQSP